MTIPSPDHNHAKIHAQPPEELTGIKLGKPSKSATGMKAVAVSLQHVFGEAGVGRGTKALLKLNQKDGFDCPSCAWPDPDGERSVTEFCENGAKAVASEATARTITAEFFAEHSVSHMSEQSDYWLEQQGRLTVPVILEAGATHYKPISWDDAFALIAQELKSLDSPNEAVFYTSGRASNEAAFLYQLFVRHYGTNNLPDCSNMCHESSGAAMKPTIGVGKGTVRLDDFHQAAFIFIIGQNPGTNHPRMLTTLQEAVRAGSHIIAVNPLKEAGLLGFKHPQEIAGLIGLATPLAKTYHQVVLNGDMAYFRGINKSLLALEEQKPGTVLDHDFLEKYSQGFQEYADILRATDWVEIERRSGIARREIEALAAKLAGQRRIISCWAMGLTQHKNSVATIAEVVNMHLLLGAVGIAGGGLCPVRGHSNVQGDRTMGIYEKPAQEWLDQLEKVYQFSPPREPGFDVVEAIHAMRDGKAKFFFALGGNFLAATPDTEATGAALRNCSMTVQVSTKLNRSHLVTGKKALILPCLGRSDEDWQDGQRQFVTVEDSMSVVHASQGWLAPMSDQMLSEVAIIARMAHATVGDTTYVKWLELGKNYDLIRQGVERVVLGFENFNQRVREPGGFYLRSTAREREFKTPTGKANFSLEPLTSREITGDQLLLQTIRSHDQYNTTVYGLNDRYRGIGHERRVIFLNPQDILKRGLKPMQAVDITSHWTDGTRQARKFLAIPYDIPAGTAAAYFPEANVLVPLDSTADISNTPTSKGVVITLAAHAA